MAQIKIKEITLIEMNGKNILLIPKNCNYISNKSTTMDLVICAEDLPDDIFAAVAQLVRTMNDLITLQ